MWKARKKCFIFLEGAIAVALLFFLFISSSTVWNNSNGIAGISFSKLRKLIHMILVYELLLFMNKKRKKSFLRFCFIFCASNFYGSLISFYVFSWTNSVRFLDMLWISVEERDKRMQWKWKFQTALMLKYAIKLF